MESDALCLDHGLSCFVYLPRFRLAEIFSFSPTSSLYYFLFHSLAPTLPKNGCGHFLPVYRISGKVHSQSTVSPHISLYSTQGIIMGFPTTLGMTLVSTNLDPSLPQLSRAPGNDRWVGHPVSTRQTRGLGSGTRRRHVHRFSWMDSLGVARYHVRR